MKQIKIILVLFIVTAATLTQAQQAKIAYINSQALLEAMPEAKEANAKLIAYANEFDSLYQSYANEYQRLVNEIQGNAALSEVAREAKIQDAM